MLDRIRKSVSRIVKGYRPNATYSFEETLPEDKLEHRIVMHHPRPESGPVAESSPNPKMSERIKHAARRLFTRGIKPQAQYGHDNRMSQDRIDQRMAPQPGRCRSEPEPHPFFGDIDKCRQKDASASRPESSRVRKHEFKIEQDPRLKAKWVDHMLQSAQQTMQTSTYGRSNEGSSSDVEPYGKRRKR